jgi:hypothetical protein
VVPKQLKNVCPGGARSSAGILCLTSLASLPGCTVSRSLQRFKIGDCIRALFRYYNFVQAHDGIRLTPTAGVGIVNTSGNGLNAAVNKSDSLARLRSMVHHLHQCAAAHEATVHVHEAFKGQTVWEGDVEVFQLFGHPETNRCYVWDHRGGPKDKIERLVAVLEIRPVVSAATAVRFQITRDQGGRNEERPR